MRYKETLQWNWSNRVKAVGNPKGTLQQSLAARLDTHTSVTQQQCMGWCPHDP